MSKHAKNALVIFCCIVGGLLLSWVSLAVTLYSDAPPPAEAVAQAAETMIRMGFPLPVCTMRFIDSIIPACHIQPLFFVNALVWALVLFVLYWLVRRIGRKG